MNAIDKLPEGWVDTLALLWAGEHPQSTRAGRETIANSFLVVVNRRMRYARKDLLSAAKNTAYLMIHAAVTVKHLGFPHSAAERLIEQRLEYYDGMISILDVYTLGIALASAGWTEDYVARAILHRHIIAELAGGGAMNDNTWINILARLAALTGDTPVPDMAKIWLDDAVKTATSASDDTLPQLLLRAGNVLYYAAIACHSGAITEEEAVILAKAITDDYQSRNAQANFSNAYAVALAEFGLIAASILYAAVRPAGADLIPADDVPYQFETALASVVLASRSPIPAEKALEQADKYYFSCSKV